MGDLNCNLLLIPKPWKAHETIDWSQWPISIETIDKSTDEGDTNLSKFNRPYLHEQHTENCVIRSPPSGNKRDHNLVYVVRKFANYAKKDHKYISSRSFKEFHSDQFKEDLSRIPWDNINKYDNPDSMWSSWKEFFLQVIDKHAPSKTRRVKNKKSPWLTPNITQLAINSINIWKSRRMERLQESKKCR